MMLSPSSPPLWSRRLKERVAAGPHLAVIATA